MSVITSAGLQATSIQASAVGRLCPLLARASTWLQSAMHMRRWKPESAHPRILWECIILIQDCVSQKSLQYLLGSFTLSRMQKAGLIPSPAGAEAIPNFLGMASVKPRLDLSQFVKTMMSFEVLRNRDFAKSRRGGRHLRPTLPCAKQGKMAEDAQVFTNSPWPGWCLGPQKPKCPGSHTVVTTRLLLQKSL